MSVCVCAHAPTRPLSSDLGQPADPRGVAAPGLLVPSCSLPGSVGGERSSRRPYNGRLGFY